MRTPSRQRSVKITPVHVIWLTRAPLCHAKPMPIGPMPEAPKLGQRSAPRVGRRCRSAAEIRPAKTFLAGVSRGRELTHDPLVLEEHTTNIH